MNSRVRPAAAIQYIERLSSPLGVAQGLSVGQTLACRIPQQCDQSRGLRLYGSEGHLTPTRQQCGCNTAPGRLEILGGGNAPCGNVNGLLRPGLRLERELGHGHGSSPDP